LSQTRITRALALLKLAPEIRGQIDAGEISARSAYEISRLPDSSAQKELARRAANSRLTCHQVSRAVRQRRGKAKPKPRSTRLTFAAEDGWRVVVSAARKGTYQEVEQALCAALEEVQLRIRNNVQLY
jgi:ParB-like chromosome segregation protein Spo0J